MKKWMLNPFVYIAGEKALVLGWAMMLATALISYFSHTHFDGVIDAHIGLKITLPLYFLEQFIVWASVVLIFYFTGKFSSTSSVRFIDVAGTMALSRWPLIFVALINFASPHVIDINHLDPAMILIALINLLFVIWMVVLMYRAFTVSCNLKGNKATGLFILALVLAEILSKYLFHLIYHPVS